MRRAKESLWAADYHLQPEKPKRPPRRPARKLLDGKCDLNMQSIAYECLVRGKDPIKAFIAAAQDPQIDDSTRLRLSLWLHQNMERE